MNKLREDAFKSPVYHIAIIVLLGIGLVFLPIEFLFKIIIQDSYRAKVLGGIFLRVILSAFAVVAIRKYGFDKPFKSHGGFKAFIACLPALVIALNNFPFSALLSGKLSFHRDAIDVIFYILYCFSVGVFEELLFCGLVFPLVLFIFKHKRYSVVWAVVISSAIFALSHLMNLFSGASFGATILQVGYSFLIGAICSICKCVTRNIFTAIVLHGVYDIGGLLLSSSVGIGVGNQWDIFTVVLTLLLGVATTIYMIILAIKIDRDEVEGLYF